MWFVMVIICLAIMSHCCISSMFAAEKYKPDSIPVVGAQLQCASNCSTWGMGSYCCLMVITVLLLIYLFSYEFVNFTDSM
jgi:hypothetical protein